MVGTKASTCELDKPALNLTASSAEDGHSDSNVFFLGSEKVKNTTRKERGEKKASYEEIGFYVLRQLASY